MTSPIRSAVHVATEFPKPANKMTLRDAVEWYKRTVRDLEPLGVPNQLETKYMNERWVTLVEGVSEREKIPVGALSYFLAELAHTELLLKKTADEEYEAAVSYGADADASEE